MSSIQFKPDPLAALSKRKAEQEQKVFEDVVHFLSSSPQVRDRILWLKEHYSKLNNRKDPTIDEVIKAVEYTHKFILANKSEIKQKIVRELRQLHDRDYGKIDALCKAVTRLNVIFNTASSANPFLLALLYPDNMELFVNADITYEATFAEFYQPEKVGPGTSIYGVKPSNPPVEDNDPGFDM